MRESSKERELVKGVYLSPNWHEKVDKMLPNQLMAVYKRLLAQGKLK